jgi:hypothetical protein
MLRFSIRELLLLTLIVALGFAWWVDHQRQVRDIESEYARAELFATELENMTGLLDKLAPPWRDNHWDRKIVRVPRH